MTEFDRDFPGVMLFGQSNMTPTLRGAIKQNLPARYYCAGIRKSGQPLSYWMANATAPYAATSVLNAEIALHGPRKYTRLGVLWWQGEHGSQGTADDSDYIPRMDATLSHISSQLLYPGGLLYLVMIQPFKTDDATAYAQVRAAMTTYAAAMPSRRVVIDSTPWPRNPPSDTVHITLTAAKDTAGPAIAAALLSIMPDL